MTKTKKLAFLGVFCALAITLSIFESFLPPPLPIPGVKWGLANIITLIALSFLGFKAACSIALARCFISSLLLGTFLAPAFFMSIAGALFSVVFMAQAFGLLPKLSLVGISIIGAIAHNLGQLLVASFIVGQAALFYYLPILLLAALPTGCITGFLANTILKHLAVDRLLG